MISPNGLGPWRRSSYSAGNGNCVEVAESAHDGCAVRDSKNPSSPVLTFAISEWSAFLKTAKHGKLDN